MPIKVLATDLDGTLIPIAGNADNRRDLVALQQVLHDRNITLIFVTGRSFHLTQQAIDQFDLPVPHSMVCDVGTSIFRTTADSTFEFCDDYSRHLSQLTVSCPISELTSELQSWSELTFQETEKQGPFKLSFYAESSVLAGQTDRLRNHIARSSLPWSVVSSQDPETGMGLIDLLPVGVSKAYALNWWASERRIAKTEIAFAGDSGNDLAALTAGYKSILVSNAHQSVRDEVSRFHRQTGQQDDLWHSQHPASSGVLDGLLQFVDDSPIR
ncbi:MAG: HAD-IIB family hydrolase [Planctomycetaceae bacterium]